MQPKQRFPWLPVSVAAAFVVVGTVAWLQIPPAAPAVKTGAAGPSLAFTRLDPGARAEVLAEHLAAYDPTPLFLPTAMNSDQKPASPVELAGGSGPFAALEPRMIYGLKKADIAFPPIVAVPANPVQGLTLANGREVPLVLGRTDAAGKSLPARAGYLEVVRSGDHRTVLTLALPAGIKSPEGDWQPLELLGAVSREGLVGDLVVTVSSGSDVVDDYFSSQLGRTVRVGERLAPGFYAFRVGP